MTKTHTTSVLAEVMGALDRVAFRSPEYVALATGRAVRTVKRDLAALRDRGLIEVVGSQQISSTGRPYTRFSWRRSCGIMPLYQSDSRCDAKALADCWAGYTFNTGGRNGFTEQL